MKGVASLIVDTNVKTVDIKPILMETIMTTNVKTTEKKWINQLPVAPKEAWDTLKKEYPNSMKAFEKRLDELVDNVQ